MVQSVYSPYTTDPWARRQSWAEQQAITTGRRPAITVAPELEAAYNANIARNAQAITQTNADRTYELAKSGQEFNQSQAALNSALRMQEISNAGSASTWKGVSELVGTGLKAIQLDKLLFEGAGSKAISSGIKSAGESVKGMLTPASEVPAEVAWNPTGSFSGITPFGFGGEEATPQFISFTSDTGQVISVPVDAAAQAYGMTPDAFTAAWNAQQAQAGMLAADTAPALYSEAGWLAGGGATDAEIAAAADYGGFGWEGSAAPSAAGAIAGLATAASKYSYEYADDVGGPLGFMMERNLAPASETFSGGVAQWAFNLNDQQAAAFSPLGSVTQGALESVGNFFSGDISGGFNSLWQGFSAPFAAIGDFFSSIGDWF